MKYLDTKENSIEDSVTRVLMGEKKLDPVNPTAVKKKFDDRKDKDIDNDGDVDSTDKYLHKRRKAISKAVKGDEKVDESMAALQRKLDKLYGPKKSKDIEKMMKDRKYKGNTSAFDAAVKKKYPNEYKTAVVQDIIRKHAETNEGFASDAQRRAAFASGYKAKGKKDKKESYEIGQDYAKHTLEVTPGQDKKDVDEMLGIANKKNMTMREALAKVWGINEGKSPFQKKEEMKKDKTMTGKKPTEVKVDPEIKK